VYLYDVLPAAAFVTAPFACAHAVVLRLVVLATCCWRFFTPDRFVRCCPLPCRSFGLDLTTVSCGCSLVTLPTATCDLHWFTVLLTFCRSFYTFVVWFCVRPPPPSRFFVQHVATVRFCITTACAVCGFYRWLPLRFDVTVDAYTAFCTFARTHTFALVTAVYALLPALLLLRSATLHRYYGSLFTRSTVATAIPLYRFRYYLPAVHAFCVTDFVTVPHTVPRWFVPGYCTVPHCGFVYNVYTFVPGPVAFAGSAVAVTGLPGFVLHADTTYGCTVAVTAFAASRSRLPPYTRGLLPHVCRYRGCHYVLPLLLTVCRDCLPFVTTLIMRFVLYGFTGFCRL